MAVRRSRNQGPAEKPVKVKRAANGPTVKKPAKDIGPIDMSKVKSKVEWVDINDVKPYAFNARDNAKAVQAVANSIKNFGFLVPIVIDADGNLAAGHTRIEAAKTLGMAEVLALRAEHLTDEQIDAFRLVDNKVSELADWDIGLLSQEIARLEGAFNFTDYGWTQDEIDCMATMVTADCLSVETLTPARNEETDSEEGASLPTRRGPQSTRLVLGEFVMFIPTTQYRNWMDGLRRFVNYDEEELAAELKNRLGILE